jgi:NADP-dependent 3-hydroxy acid dehydrogenase YdfG
MGDKKVIWITGASSGIGKALTIKFAESGWIVAASARRENLLNELNELNKNIYPFPLDVTEIENCKIVAKKIIDQFKQIDICVFGTGMHDPKSEKKFNLNKIREIMEVNYFGTMNSINSIYDYFSEKKKWANINNIFSCRLQRIACCRCILCLKSSSYQLCRKFEF